MGRHVFHLMALAHRPPPASGRGGNCGGGSPSISITPVHRVYVPLNRSTVHTPTLRISGRVTCVLAAYHPFRPSTHLVDSFRVSATAEPRRRRRLLASGLLWRTLPPDSTRRHLPHRFTSPAVIHPGTARTAFSPGFARPYSRAPTRRLPRHQPTLPSGLRRLGASRTADSPSIWLPSDQAHSAPLLPWPFGCLPTLHTSYRAFNRWVVSAVSAFPALPFKPPPASRSLCRTSALTPACASFSLALRPFFDTAQPVQPSSRQSLRRFPALRSPCSPGWPPSDMPEQSSRHPSRHPPAFCSPCIPLSTLPPSQPTTHLPTDAASMLLCQPLGRQPISVTALPPYQPPCQPQTSATAPPYAVPYTSSP